MTRTALIIALAASLIVAGTARPVGGPSRGDAEIECAA